MRPISDRDRAIRNRLAERGIEMTPDEVAEQRAAALHLIRSDMRAKGYAMPDGDAELLAHLRELDVDSGGAISRACGNDYPGRGADCYGQAAVVGGAQELAPGRDLYRGWVTALAAGAYLWAAIKAVAWAWEKLK